MDVIFGYIFVNLYKSQKKSKKVYYCSEVYDDVALLKPLLANMIGE